MADPKTNEPGMTADQVQAMIAAAVSKALAEAAEKTKADAEPKPKKYDMTKAQSHKATARGYAKGDLVEIGEIVPEGIPVSTEWMEPIKGNGKLDRALQEAGQDHPEDVDLTQLSKPALQAMAAERGINVGGLSSADLITAIKAEREPTI